ncbi:MAG: maleylpyruvate isomerase family mycothiol-dependent enzyme [Actinomycetota bacterium]|nr:maleylpyruvate isomerase family mycothiol-dependent enzyme [Actinomycetota bacterium]
MQPSPALWSHDAYVAVVGTNARRLLDAAATGDPEAAVPGCPGWTITDLVAHVGSIHRWASQVVLTGNPAELPVVPDDVDVLLPWARDGAAHLVEVLASADPHKPTWTFGPKPRVAAFWSRRQAHETTMHLWDAEDARGHEYRWDPRLAADGVDEVATVFYPRQVRLGRTQPLPGPVHLDVIDAPGVAITLGEVDAAPGADAAPSATLRGTAEELLLALWGRRSLDALEISGDGPVIDALRGSAITP